MKTIIVGLGNTGKEYENTRHNLGRDVVLDFAKKNGLKTLELNEKTKSLEGNIKIGNKSAAFVLPETFMNKSGEAVRHYIKSKSEASNLIVVYDELDLPIGKFKISFGRNSGGHRGIESIINTIKTKDFVRLRVGISPHTSSGKLKKPSGEKEVIDFILGAFKKGDLEEIKKVSKKINEALETLVIYGKERAMSEFN